MAEFKQKFLTDEEKSLFLTWVAGHGTAYKDYLIWCEEMSIPNERRYTEKSLKVIIQRNRPAMKQRQIQVNQQAIAAAAFPRYVRIAALQKAVERLDAKLEMSDELSVRDYVALEEQRRKTLETIAREMGEYGKSPEDDRTNRPETGQDSIAAYFMQQRINEARVIDGETSVQSL